MESTSGGQYFAATSGAAEVELKDARALRNWERFSQSVSPNLLPDRSKHVCQRIEGGSDSGNAAARPTALISLFFARQNARNFSKFWTYRAQPNWQLEGHK
jgi:hypothetical protein